MTQLHHILQTHPGMYLATIEQELNFGSMCYNFLNAIINLPELDSSGHIDASVASLYFTMSAIGWDVTTNNESFSTISNVFNVDNFSPTILNKVSTSVGYLAPIIWFAEYCAVDVNNGSKSYQEIFLDGRPIKESMIMKPTNSSIPRIGFCFTLPTNLFKSQLMDIASLKKSISLWRKAHHNRKTPQHTRVPKLHLRWAEQDEYNYNLRAYFSDFNGIA